jgi:tetratricopeptide (TPR) repeat protein
LIKRANILLATGDKKSAIQDYTKALALEPDNVEALENRGKAYTMLQNWDAAEKDFTRALEVKPDLRLALLNRAEARYRSGKYDEALKDYDQLKNLGKVDAELLFRRAQLLLALKRCQEALPDLDRVLELDPNNLSARELRGEAHAALQQFDKAIGDFDAVLAKKPTDTKYLLARAAAHEALNHYTKALKDFERAVQTAPGAASAEMYYRLGRSYLLNLKFPQAVDAFTKAIDKDPRLGLAYANRGVAYKALKDYDKAQRDFKEAMKFLDTQERKEAVLKLLKETQSLVRQPVLPDPLADIRASPEEHGQARVMERKLW